MGKASRRRSVLRAGREIEQGPLLGPFEEAIHIRLEAALRQLSALHPVQRHRPGQNLAACLPFPFRLALPGPAPEVRGGDWADVQRGQDESRAAPGSKSWPGACV